jgi:hypothetical protein
VAFPVDPEGNATLVQTRTFSCTNTSDSNPSYELQLFRQTILLHPDGICFTGRAVE